MRNEMFDEIQLGWDNTSPEEKLYIESRKTLAYVKAGLKRLVLLMRKLEHFRRNPLGNAMCKQMESQIYNQSLLLKRHQRALHDMVETYNRQLEDVESTASEISEQSQTSSSRADWEEVIAMSKMPIHFVSYRPRSVHGFDDKEGRSHGFSTPGDSQAASPEASSLHLMCDQKFFPTQMTPPMEEVIELKARIKELEKSPLFTSSPFAAKHSRQLGHVLGAHHNHHQHTPLSLP
ncbi:hypothetical protein FBU59_002389 [Linderina macrospora]|uniref:Uncharacterized protein n=1 Tax=Linderina macrospora TaxID=4868 RepID=A0ACC1JBK1_9FUNG|nr:hypothetical protein FBU59_002389 [Linderina macrospora]